MHAEDAVRTRHHPVYERRFFQIGNAIETCGDVVSRGKHVACNLRLDGVNVVQEMRWADDAYEEDKASCGEDDSTTSKCSTSTSETCSAAGSSMFQRLIHINNTISPHN